MKSIIGAIIMIALTVATMFMVNANVRDIHNLSNPYVPKNAIVSTGVADSFGGQVKVVVKHIDNKIYDLQIDASKESPDYGQKAVAPLRKNILKNGTVEGIDAYSGATGTSNAIFEAIDNALNSDAVDSKSSASKQ